MYSEWAPVLKENLFDAYCVKQSLIRTDPNEKSEHGPGHFNPFVASTDPGFGNLLEGFGLVLTSFGTF